MFVESVWMDEPLTPGNDFRGEEKLNVMFSLECFAFRVDSFSLRGWLQPQLQVPMKRNTAVTVGLKYFVSAMLSESNDWTWR